MYYLVIGYGNTLRSDEGIEQCVVFQENSGISPGELLREHIT
jgi:Ni,Fe-hydrogenase maturation factor